MKVLLEHGANVNVWNGYLLICESCNSNISLTKVLLENGANPNIYCYGISPLIYAVKAGHTEMVKLLLEYGANVHINNDNPIQISCENCHTNITQLLIENKCLPIININFNPYVNTSNWI